MWSEAVGKTLCFMIKKTNSFVRSPLCICTLLLSPTLLPQFQSFGLSMQNPQTLHLFNLLLEYWSCTAFDRFSVC